VPAWSSRVQKTECKQANTFTTDDVAEVKFVWDHSL
jgi:hypothetical protein